MTYIMMLYIFSIFILYTYYKISKISTSDIHLGGRILHSRNCYTILGTLYCTTLYIPSHPFCIYISSIVLYHLFVLYSYSSSQWHHKQQAAIPHSHSSHST